MAMAALLPTYVYSDLAKVPLDQTSTSVLDGHASRVMAVEETPDGPKPGIRENVDLTVTAKVQANFARPEMTEGSDVAVWVQAIQATDNTDGKVVTANKRQVCFNRFTSLGAVGGDECAPDSSFLVKRRENPPSPGAEPEEYAEYQSQSGLQFKYPFGTERTDYQVWDTTMSKPATSRFAGTGQVGGMPVYKFAQRVPATQFTEQTVSGELVGGQPKTSVRVGRFYSTTATDYVEPTTGLILKREQHQVQELRIPGQGTGTVVFDGRLEYSEETTNAMLDKARESTGKLRLLSTTGPLVLGPVGAVLFVIGVVLLARRGGPRREDDMFDSTERIVPRSPAPVRY